MTLGRLIELYKAEQEGKQIVLRITRFTLGEDVIQDRLIKLSECNLEQLVKGHGYGISYKYFIKNEEDEDGNKIK